jgi:hypothetical protein
MRSDLCLPAHHAVLLQVLDDNRIKHYFAGTDMKKQVRRAKGHTLLYRAVQSGAMSHH